MPPAWYLRSLKIKVVPLAYSITALEPELIPVSTQTVFTCDMWRIHAVGNRVPLLSLRPWVTYPVTKTHCHFGQCGVILSVIWPRLACMNNLSECGQLTTTPSQRTPPGSSQQTRFTYSADWFVAGKQERILMMIGKLSIPYSKRFLTLYVFVLVACVVVRKFCHCVAFSILLLRVDRCKKYSWLHILWNFWDQKHLVRFWGGNLDPSGVSGIFHFI